MDVTAQSSAPARIGLDALLGEVSREKANLVAYLSEGIEPERFMALARRAILEQPGLADCSVASVLRALRECALSGLELDGKVSTLIVRKSKQGRPVATWDATYRGMITLALSGGYVRSVEAQVVRGADEFSVELGSEPRLIHRPRVSGSRGEVIAAYAVAELTAGGRVIELLTAEDIGRVRAWSPAGERGPWGMWADEMARKSALRRLLKKLPGSAARVLPEARSPSQAEHRGTELAPEHAHALECTALDALSSATSVGELDMAWAQARVEFGQRGAPVPLAVEVRWREIREAMPSNAEG